MSDNIKNTDSSIRVISSERLTKGDDRATHSYKTIVQCDNIAALLSPDFWPEKIGCRIFIGKNLLKISIDNYFIMANSTVITTLNCEGVVRSTDYIKLFMDETSCDILCLQEMWLHENDLVKLCKINSNYMNTGVSGMSSSQILRGRPYGGTAILFKKSLAHYVTPINCKNKE